MCPMSSVFRVFPLLVGIGVGMRDKLVPAIQEILVHLQRSSHNTAWRL